MVFSVLSNFYTNGAKLLLLLETLPFGILHFHHRFLQFIINSRAEGKSVRSFLIRGGGLNAISLSGDMFTAGGSLQTNLIYSGTPLPLTVTKIN